MITEQTGLAAHSGSFLLVIYAKLGKARQTRA
jgi:hypothetical protein